VSFWGRNIRGFADTGGRLCHYCNLRLTQHRPLQCPAHWRMADTTQIRVARQPDASRVSKLMPPMANHGTVTFAAAQRTYSSVTGLAVGLVPVANTGPMAICLGRRMRRAGPGRAREWTGQCGVRSAECGVPKRDGVLPQKILLSQMAEFRPDGRAISRWSLMTNDAARA